MRDQQDISSHERATNELVSVLYHMLIGKRWKVTRSMPNNHQETPGPGDRPSHGLERTYQNADPDPFFGAAFLTVVATFLTVVVAFLTVAGFLVVLAA